MLPSLDSASSIRQISDPRSNILRTSFSGAALPSQSSSRSGSPVSRLPTAPPTNGGAAHHRPAFVHASTSIQVPTVQAPSHPPSPYGFPPEKEAPPAYPYSVDYDTGPHDLYRPSSAHHSHSNSQYGHAFAHASRASSRRSSVIPVAEPCFLHKMKDKLLGKEGGMGRALVLGWVITTLGFVIATAFWKGELFGALDRLSKNLLGMGLEGKLIFILLIFITTVPPLPLYSTLMVLAGYTFGVWEGFVVSYIASLSGAVIVFIVSRTLLRDVITKSLSTSPTAQSLLAIIPANPHLLLLIRIAPYPYNLLNVILASAPSLSLRTYTACTAVSLLKLVLHTWIGAGIHDITSFGHSRGDAPPDWAGENGGEWTGEHRPGHGGGGRYGSHHGHGGHGYGHGPGWGADQRHRGQVRMYSTWVGIVLCVALFFYLTHLAKKALRKAQEEEEIRREEMLLMSGSEEEC